MLTRDRSAFSTRLPLLQAACLVLLGLIALGCSPKIGDSCTISTNCSASGDRLCDVTQPGGYCTVFNCEPGSCPTDSVCINFGTALSPLPECSTDLGNSPYQRSFCMATCGNNGDCRGGYSCQNLSGVPNADGSPSNDLGAVLAESSGNGMVCAANQTGAAPVLVTYPPDGDGGAPGTNNEVCSPTIPRATGSSGAAGESGASGAAGSDDSGAGG
jgi:hypothetical protein